MPDRSFYDVLGVARTASEDEIRAAYRKLAREHHPDVSKAPDAAERFAKITEAYDVLADKDKRARYDRFGTATPGQGRAGGGGAGVSAEGIDLDDLNSVFESFFGGRARSPGRRPTPAPDATHTIRIPFLTMMRGGEHRLTVERSQKQREITVDIPAGIRDGAKLRVRGEGHDLPGRPGKRSDLILTVRVDPHPSLRRGRPESGEREQDVYASAEIDVATATFGGKTEVATPEGLVEVGVPEACPSGKKLRLRGLGVGGVGAARGDLYAEIRIIPPRPEKLSPDDEAVLRRIVAKGTGHAVSPDQGA